VNEKPPAGLSIQQKQQPRAPVTMQRRTKTRARVGKQESVVYHVVESRRNRGRVRYWKRKRGMGYEDAAVVTAVAAAVAAGL
jgi:hypothetical protein